MTLLSHVLAALVAAALLSWRARVRGAWSGLSSIAPIVATAILAFVALSGAWSTWRTLRSEYNANSKIPAVQAEVRGGETAGANVPFVEWLNATLPQGAPYYVYATDKGGGGYQWLTYRLYPRVAVTDPEDARWFVFAGGVSPAAAGLTRREVSLREFQPGLALGERR